MPNFSPERGVFFLLFFCVCASETCRYKYGYAYEFGYGLRAAADCGAARNAAVHSSTGHTFQVWVKPYDLSFSRAQCLVSNLVLLGSESFNSGLYIVGERVVFARSSRSFSFYYGGFASFVLERQRWVHVTATISRSGVSKLYRNGTLVATAAGEELETTSLFHRDTALLLGGDLNLAGSTAKWLFSGQMDEIRYYDYVMPEDVVAATWSRGIESPETAEGLVLYLNGDRDSRRRAATYGQGGCTVNFSRSAGLQKLFGRRDYLVADCSGCFSGSELSRCVPMDPQTSGTCGDGMVMGDEECDGGEGCSETCTCLEGYSPSGLPYCNRTVGDGRCRVWGSAGCRVAKESAGCAELADFVDCTLARGCTADSFGVGMFSTLEQCFAACRDEGARAVCYDVVPEFCYRFQTRDACAGHGCFWCRETCTTTAAQCAPICGDGVVDGGEECDDGNGRDGDGCDGACNVERGWACQTGADNRSRCATVCGDGIVIAGHEACDGGVAGCDPETCQSAPGWSCRRVSDGEARCAPICGDGIVIEGLEECDDGNAESGDGCSANCTTERLYFCVNLRDTGSVCYSSVKYGLIVAGGAACALLVSYAAVRCCVWSNIRACAAAVRRRWLMKRGDETSVFMREVGYVPHSAALEKSNETIGYIVERISELMVPLQQGDAGKGAQKRRVGGGFLSCGGAGGRRRGRRESLSISGHVSKEELKELSEGVSDTITFGFDKESTAEVGRRYFSIVRLLNTSGLSQEWRIFPVNTYKCTIEARPDHGKLEAMGTRLVLVILVAHCTTTLDEEVVMNHCKSGTMSRHSCYRVRLETKVSTRLDPNCVVPEKFIGEGSFGVVYRGFYRSQDVCIKYPKAQQGKNEAQFVEEVALLDRLRSPYIIPFIGAVVVPGKQCIVTPYCPLGSILHVVHNPRTDSAIRLKIALDCARGMLYLHNNRILHRDLKPDNVLLVSDSPAAAVTCVLTDFGTTRDLFYSSTQTTMRCVGTPMYMAPEILAENMQYISQVLAPAGCVDMFYSSPMRRRNIAEELRKNNFEIPVNYTVENDVFSFGVLLWEIFSGVTPYSSKKFKRVMDIVDYVVGGKRLAIPPRAEDIPAVAELIGRCWAIDPEERPLFLEIAQTLDREFQACYSHLEPVDAAHSKTRWRRLTDMADSGRSATADDGDGGPVTPADTPSADADLESDKRPSFEP